MGERLTVIRHENKPPDVYELANKAKARGYDRYYAWDMYVKWTNLKPEVDAKEFYEIFDRSPGDWTQELAEVDFEPTHFDRLCEQTVQITTDEHGVFLMIWQDGTTGSNPPKFPPEEDRFMPLVESEDGDE